MADKQRWNLDEDGPGSIHSDLLKDVQQAANHVKQQKAKDKAKQQRYQTAAKERPIMIAIIAVAAVVIFALAYWNTFVRGSAPAPAPEQSQSVTQPAQPPVQPPVQTVPQQPVQRYAAPNYARPRPAPPIHSAPAPAANSAEDPDSVGM